MYFFGAPARDSGRDSSAKDSIISDCTGVKPKYYFPSPQRLSKSANLSYCSTASDSSNDTHYVERNFCYSKKKKQKSRANRLPPLGIYWDIENCSVPKSKSAAAVVQKIREVFLENYRESEFVVVCDVKKESPQIIQELHDAQVLLIHVSSTSKNAADEKLRQSLRRFGELHPAPSGVVLISGDINFAADLSDFRYRKKIRVILVHNVNVADALILCANEHHSFSELMKDLPINNKFKAINDPPAFLTITNLPINFDYGKVKCRLHKLIDNCGGKVTDLRGRSGTASVRFGNLDTALRAQRRIQGEDVFGNKIKVLSPSVRNFTGNKIRNGETSFKTFDMPSMPPPGFPQLDFHNSFANQSANKDQRRQVPAIMSAPCGFRPIRGAGASSAASPMEVAHEASGPKRAAERRSLTPQEQLLKASCGPSNASRVHKTTSGSEFNSDEQRLGYMNEMDGKNVQSNQSVDLVISNLDPTIEVKELRRLLTNMLKEYAMVLSLTINVQADGSPIANIRVNSQHEAQFTISQLHRQKLGHKRIIISYAQTNSPDPEQLRAIIVDLLQEVPENCMPLFKFLDLLESRYHCTISVSEVNKLKDICKITDDLGSRIITLTQEMKTSPPPNLCRTLIPYCVLHCPNGLQNRGWCELSVFQAPNIKMSLKLFCSKLIMLLKVHLGCMHLMSFQACYEQEFHEPLPVDDGGVPLEHLISCVPNMEIKSVGTNKNIKVIKYEETKNTNEEETVLKSVPPPLAPNISLLCRELVDLLKTTDKCQLLLSKFIPAYHHHFGRQCRVADYGYTKLLDLFESISHVVQIMGDGTRRTITLSHTAQMRRFTSDLLRVLKVQPAKQIAFTDFPSAYEKVMNKPFNAVEYGLCTFEDLLQEVPENTVVISRNDEGIFIAVPKREQTAEEIMRTKQFAAEVIDLLRHSPYYTMLFNKFVPAYHHHFGHQCKVSDYGFTKLIELFEAIPDVVKIKELPDGERTVHLTQKQALRIIGTQIVQIIRANNGSILLSDLPNLYLREFGYQLKPAFYECDTYAEIAAMLSDYIQVNNSNAGLLLVAIDVDTIPNTLKIRSWALLLDPPHCMELNTFRYEYKTRFISSFTLDSLQQIGNVISISSTSDEVSYVSLTALYILAAQLYHVIYSNGGSVLYYNLEKLYQDYYGKMLKLMNYQIFSVDEFYNHFNLLFFIRGSKKKSTVMLHRNLAEHFVPLPPAMYKSGQMPMNSKRESPNWPPPPPPPDMVQTALKKVSPPKPDTPPTPDNNPWNHWSSAFDLNLSIQMPLVFNPKLLGDADSLISPARHLLPSRNPWANITSILEAPDPTELPMPDKLITKNGVVSDDSADSGVNIKLENSPSDTETDTNTTEHHSCGKLSEIEARILNNIAKALDKSESET